MAVFRMVEGTGKAKTAMALYTRCADEALCRAELVLLVEDTKARFPGAEVVAYYDVDPTFTPQRFCRSYNDRPDRKKRLLELAKTVMQDWPYPVVDDEKVLS